MKKGLKKSGGGPPDLSSAGSREWVSSLKGPSSTRKMPPPPKNDCDSKGDIESNMCYEKEFNMVYI